MGSYANVSRHTQILRGCQSRDVQLRTIKNLPEKKKANISGSPDRIVEILCHYLKSKIHILCIISVLTSRQAYCRGNYYEKYYTDGVDINITICLIEQI